MVPSLLRHSNEYGGSVFAYDVPRPLAGLHDGLRLGKVRGIFLRMLTGFVLERQRSLVLVRLFSSAVLGYCVALPVVSH